MEEDTQKTDIEKELNKPGEVPAKETSKKEGYFG